MQPVIYALSDLHGNLPDPKDIPPCDLVLIAGDITPVDDHGYHRQYRFLHGPFAEWIRSLRTHDVVWTLGNHDFIGQEAPEALEGLPGHLLIDREVTVQGLRIYGTPWAPKFGSWAFMKSEGELEQIYSRIPNGLDVLISHGPPHSYCDRNIAMQNCGSIALQQVIRAAKPQAVVCGHIHEAYGLRRCGKSDIYNVSRMNFYYQPVNPAVQIHLA